MSTDKILVCIRLNFSLDNPALSKYLQAVLYLHSSLTTPFALVILFFHSVLNHSSPCTVFCLHGCLSEVSKNGVSRGPSVLKVKDSFSYSIQELLEFYEKMAQKVDFDFI